MDTLTSKLLTLTHGAKSFLGSLCFLAIFCVTPAQAADILVPVKVTVMMKPITLSNRRGIDFGSIIVPKTVQGPFSVELSSRGGINSTNDFVLFAGESSPGEINVYGQAEVPASIATVRGELTGPGGVKVTYTLDPTNSVHAGRSLALNNGQGIYNFGGKLDFEVPPESGVYSGNITFSVNY